ncbi:MAG: hypothetical protein HY951_10500 [Bacteroidia bacterium]|nr:hypothetical protein [Bacteroidia bacterium]
MLKIKNILTILILVAFAFNSFGFIFYFLIERENAKGKAFEEIALLKFKDKIEIISVSKTLINEGKIFQRINKKEIKYEGKMYDIVKEEKRTDKIIFYCINDKKEDKLEKEFAKTVNKNLNQNVAVGSSINFNHLIQYAEYGRVPGIESPIQKVKYSNYLNSNYHLNTLKVLTPPPKVSHI